MGKSELLPGKILKLQQLFAKNWLQYGGPGYQSRVVAGRLSKSVESVCFLALHAVLQQIETCTLETYLKPYNKKKIKCKF